jgi:spore coat protein U-like protein
MLQRLGTLIGTCAIVALTIWGSPAFAGSKSSPLNSTANVTGNCTAISPASISFGNYNPNTYPTGTPLEDSTAAVFSTNCTQGDSISWTVGIGNNCNKGFVSNDRAMTDGASHYLSYELYQNSSFTTRWAYGSSCGAPTAVTQTGGGTATANSINVYGLIPGGQNVYTGSGATNYTDSVTVTVSF